MLNQSQKSVSLFMHFSYIKSMHPFSAAWRSSKSADSGALWFSLHELCWDQFNHKQASKRTRILFICFDLLFILCLHLLQQLELYLSSGTVCLTIYSLVAGVFGMNIPYTWNDKHGYMFKWVVLFSLVNLAPDYKLHLYRRLCVFLFCQVVIVTGAFCASLFVVLMTYASYKGLVGSWNFARSL